MLSAIINFFTGTQKPTPISQDLINSWIDELYREENSIDGIEYEFVFHLDSDYYSEIESDLEALYEQREMVNYFEGLVS